MYFGNWAIAESITVGYLRLFITIPTFLYAVLSTGAANWFVHDWTRSLLVSIAIVVSASIVVTATIVAGVAVIASIGVVVGVAVAIIVDVSTLCVRLRVVLRVSLA